MHLKQKVVDNYMNWLSFKFQYTSGNKSTFNMLEIQCSGFRICWIGVEEPHFAGTISLHDSCGVSGAAYSIDFWTAAKGVVFSVKKAPLVLFVLGFFSFSLHVFWVVLQTAYELCDWVALEADLIDCVEQRKPKGRRRHSWVLEWNKLISFQSKWNLWVCLTCRPCFCAWGWDRPQLLLLVPAASGHSASLSPVPRWTEWDKNQDMLKILEFKMREGVHVWCSDWRKLGNNYSLIINAGTLPTWCNQWSLLPLMKSRTCLQCVSLK